MRVTARFVKKVGSRGSLAILGEDHVSLLLIVSESCASTRSGCACPRGSIGSRHAKRGWLLRLRIVVFGAEIVALDEEFVALFLQRLRHGADWNQWLVRAEGKSSVVVADQSVPQVGRPTVQKIEGVLLRGV
jgi:hypothetical protein